MASEINYLAPREKTRMAQVHLVNPPRKHDMRAYADAGSLRPRQRRAPCISYLPCIHCRWPERGCTLVRATYYLFVFSLNSAMYLPRLAGSVNVTGDRRECGFRARL